MHSSQRAHHLGATGALQTDLDTALGVALEMHRKLYSLMDRYVDVCASEGMKQTMNQLADKLTPACGKLAPDIALVDRWLADHAVLRDAVAAPSPCRRRCRTTELRPSRYGRMSLARSPANAPR